MHAAREARGGRRGRAVIHVVIDECHLFLNPSRTKREDLGPPPLEGCLRRQRKYGVAIWVISQTVCDLPSSVRANLGTVVALTLSNLRCAQLVAGSMGLSREQADLVPTLPTRHAVVRSHALDEPVAIRVADLPELQAPDRARLEREMREILSRLPCTGTGQQDGTASAGYLSSARERAATGRAGRGPGRPAPGDAWGGAGGRAAQPHGGAAGSPGRGDGSPGAGGEAPIELGHAGHLGNGAPAGDTGTSAETGASAASGTKPGTGNGTGAGPGGAGAGVRELLAPA
ncbi:MAG: ATP-binding protein, partial [Candidatus Aenigmarchaeota archaeon]|nr:ATP-binding protein [Candidatus Aenigmarchaeota archaeon]